MGSGSETERSQQPTKPMRLLQPWRWPQLIGQNFVADNPIRAHAACLTSGSFHFTALFLPRIKQFTHLCTSLPCPRRSRITPVDSDRNKHLIKVSICREDVPEP